MKLKALVIALLAVQGLAHAAPWTYRGTLNDGGKPANGVYDLRLTLINDLGTQSVTQPLTLFKVPVSEGSFAVEVDFGVDLTQAPAMKLKTEIAQGNSGFVVLGEPTRFDPKATVGGTCWETTGNTGTTNSNYLGTADNQPLEIRTSGRRALRLEPSAEIGSNSRPLTSNTVAGSAFNGVIAPARGATIAGGGAENNFDPTYTTGGTNRIDDHYGTIGGGFDNQAGSPDGNATTAAFATVGGGRKNTAGELNSTVSGGFTNTASGEKSTVSGGSTNQATGQSSTVSGGAGNSASSLNATTAGGVNNQATGVGSAVGGGQSNTAAGILTFVAGGASNCAGGDYSWAGGQFASTRVGNGAGDGTCAASSGDSNGDEGTFVWADQSSSADFVSSGANQFLVRADGGVAINTNNIGTSDDMVIEARTSGDDSANLRLRAIGGRTANFVVDAVTGTMELSSFPPNGQSRMTFFGGNGGLASLSNGGTWTNASSRSYKENFSAVDGLEVLSRLVKMPIMTWDYKGSSEGQHMGPVAEDFKQTFGLAGDGKSISTVDADGVALAAIQGLNAKLEIERAANASLRARLEAIEARLSQ